MDKVNRLLAALERDPELLMAVKIVLKDKKVAGPWHSSRQGYRRRDDAESNMVVRVALSDKDRYLRWGVKLSKEFDPHREKSFASEGEALRWADQQLQEKGYLLVGGVP